MGRYEIFLDEGVSLSDATATALRIFEIVLEDATPESVASFGELVAFEGGRPTSRTRFYADAVELAASPAFSSDADTCLSIARVHPRPLEVVWMERHFKHTQVFLPLNAQPYCVVLAPPGEGNVPNLGKVRALRFEGDCGLLMHRGTWHEFPFALEATTDFVVVLRNETNRNLDAIEGGEAIGEDLEKRNIGKRLGIRLRVNNRAS